MNNQIKAMTKQIKNEIQSDLATLERSLSVKEFAELNGLKVQHVYSMIRNKTLPHHKLGSLVRIFQSEANEATRRN